MMCGNGPEICGRKPAIRKLQRAVRVIVVVVREGLRHRIHARMAADAVIQEQAAVTTWTAANVLTYAIGR